jgi:hypothetical protein
MSSLGLQEKALELFQKMATIPFFHYFTDH